MYLLSKNTWAEYQDTKTDFVCASDDKEALRAYVYAAFPEIIWENDVAVIVAYDDGYGTVISEEYFEIIEIEKEVLRKLKGKDPRGYLGLPITIERASQIALTMGETTCQAIKANKQMKIKLEETYRIAVAKATKVGYSIEFPKGEIHVPAAFLIGTAHVAVQWDESQDCWSIQTIPLERGGFKSKFKLTPVGDEIFCHPAGFISKTKTGRFNLVEV